MRKLDTLFKQFINAPIQIFRGSTFTKGLSDLTQVYDNTESGDLVIVKGNHNIANNSIQLKDGVNWNFVGNPIISSDSSLGTFRDINSAINVHFDGDVVITNSLGLASRIILQNASTSISGFKWVFAAQITWNWLAAPTVTIIENTLGVIPTWINVDNTNTSLEMTATGAFTANKTSSFTLAKSQDDVSRYLIGSRTNSNIYSIISYNSGGDATVPNDGLTHHFSIVVFP